MAPPKSAIDNADNIQKFIAQMKPSNGNGNNPWSSVKGPAQQNGLTAANGDEDELTRVTQPMGIPVRAAGTANSPETHPIPSPHASGLLAPQNTPYTRPASPLPMSTHVAEHNGEVSVALSEFVNNMQGKPLSDSYWAPANVAARAAATARGGAPAIPRNLTPTSIVTPNPAINDTFERMSFRAADHDHKIGGNIFGDRNTRSALSNAGAKQPFVSPIPTSKDIMQSAKKVSVGTLSQTSSNSMGKEPNISVSIGHNGLSGSSDVGKQPIDPVSVRVPNPSSSSNLVVKATNRLGKTLPKSRAGKAPTTDDRLLADPCALEASGGLSSDQLSFLKDTTNKVVAKDKAQESKANGSAKAVTEAPNVMPAKANGVKTHVDHAGNPEPGEVLTRKLRLKEKEYNDINTSNAEMHADLAALRDNLRQKEKAQKDYEAVWLDKEAMLEKEMAELLAELTRIQGLIEKLGIKQKELKALDVSNAGQGAVLLKTLQDTRRELRHKEEAYKDVEMMNERKQAKLEGEIKELRTDFQIMMATKVTQKGKAPLKTTEVGKMKSKGKENLEEQVIFNSWLQAEKRDRAPAKNCKVILKNLPTNASLAFVASVVYFGPIEEIFMRGDNTATVKFLNPADCQKYYDDTSNGVVYKKDMQGRELVVFVELAKDVDVIGGLLQGWIDTGASRCVRVIGVEEHWGKVALTKLAEVKGRVLEGMSDGVTPGGSRVVMFRFGKIDHAVTFKASLARDENFEQCNIHFAMDPCEVAKEVHFGD